MVKSLVSGYINVSFLGFIVSNIVILVIIRQIDAGRLFPYVRVIFCLIDHPLNFLIVRHYFFMGSVISIH